MRRFVVAGVAALVAGILPLVQGCGGSGGDGGGSSGGAGERAVKTTIQWPARSKVIYAPGPAKSVKFTFLSRENGGEVGSVVFNRKAETAQYIETVTSSSTIKFSQNAFVAKVEFHTDSDAGGAVVGTAQQNVSLGQDGTILGPNGQTASFTVDKKVAFLEIPSGQTVSVGETKNIEFLARAADFTTIALSDGSAFFTQLSGTNSITVAENGAATGKATGSATVRARIENIQSATATIGINLGVATVEIPAGQALGVGESTTLSVVAKKANGEVITLPVGSLTVTATAGGENLKIGADGSITGQSIGVTTVKATVGGVTSATSDVNVTIGGVFTSATGLKFQEKKITNGQQAANGLTATVKYVGTLTDGTQFDAGTFDFKLGAGTVVKGFNEGVLSMKVGGERLLTIPPDLGYGDNPPAGGKIPKNATLIFDVTLQALK